MSKDAISNNSRIETPETAKNIGESELESVTGGNDDKRKCFFVPEKPTKHTYGGDARLRVKCSSSCGIPGSCVCEHTDRCINRFHLMERLVGEIYVPKPVDKYNHERGDKAVRDLKLP